MKQNDLPAHAVPDTETSKRHRRKKSGTGHTRNQQGDLGWPEIVKVKSQGRTRYMSSNPLFANDKGERYNL